MKIFVIGSSQTGKSPLAKALAENMRCKYLSTSGWVRNRFTANDYPTTKEFITAMTEYSINELRENPDRCIEYLNEQHDLSQACVIDGVRNPHDFIKLFDPKYDSVIILQRKKNPIRPTQFESGIELISAYLQYLEKTGLIDQQLEQRIYRYNYALFRESERTTEPKEHLDTLEEIITVMIARFTNHISEQQTPIKKYFVHADIDPIDVEIQSEFLHDMDTIYIGKSEPAKIIGISSYPGSTPTFKIVLKNRCLFSYIPPHAVKIATDKISEQKQLPLEELVYHNCPSENIAVHSFHELQKMPVVAFFKTSQKWLNATYITTIDWYEGNDLLHMIKLENGQFAFLPNHKIKFGNNEHEFPKYKKLHHEWCR